jgi:hypothetical protein
LLAAAQSNDTAAIVTSLAAIGSLAALLGDASAGADAARLSLLQLVANATTSVVAGAARSNMTAQAVGGIATALAALADGAGAQADVALSVMDIAAAVAPALNGGAASTASDAARDALLALVASTAQAASSGAPSALLLDGIIAAGTALVAADGAQVSSAASTPALRAVTVNGMLQGIDAAVAAGLPLSAASVANLAALTATSVADSTALTPLGATAAAALCLAAANATAGQTSVTVANVVLSISNLSAVNATLPAASGAASGAPFVTALSPALDAVAGSLLGVMVAGGSASLKVSSPNVVLSVAAVALPPPGSNASVTIENAVVPASALPNSSTLRAVHFTTTFDYHAGLEGTSGVTRLAFSDADGPVPMADLPQPITLDLPLVAVPADSVAEARFWDESLSAYTIAGVVTMPGAAPPGLTLSWDPNTTDLNLAWQLTGDDAERCGQLLLDCNSDDDRAQFVSLRPELAIGDPAVACAPGQTDILRILYGHNCSLWRVNETGCYFNATQQRFRGDACMPASVTRMATKHLTDFIAVNRPVIQIAPPSQLGLSLDDLRRLRLLVCVVVILFGAMHVGAVPLAAKDAREQARAMRLIMSPECGCAIVDGCPVWRLKQEPLGDGSGSELVHGSAVTVAGILGIPFVRLAMAVPEHLLGVQSLQAAMGRADGLSPTALKANGGAEAANGVKAEAPPSPPPPRSPSPPPPSPPPAAEKEDAGSEAGTEAEFKEADLEAAEEHEAATAEAHCADIDVPEEDAPAPPAASPVPRSQHLLRVTTGDSSADKAGDAAGPDANEMASTALCHAVQLAYCFGDSADVADHQVAYLRRLRASPGGDVARYWAHFEVFKEMAIGVGLRSAASWLPAARLWRVVLTAEEGGRFWEADGGVAAALLASTAQVARPRLRGLQLLLSHAQGAASALATVLLGSAGASAASQAAYEGRRSTPYVTTGRRSQGGPARADDCPLAFTADAVRSTIPDGLQSELEDRNAAERVWTTALVAALLPNLLAAWIVDDAGADDAGADAGTLADTARAWLIKQLGGRQEALDALLQRAEAQLSAWEVCHDRLVTNARSACIATPGHHALLMQRCTGSVVHSLLTKHTTVGLFTAGEFVGGRRWQSFMVVVSALIAVLMSSIWLYYSRARTCCNLVRSSLGCALDVALPCRGFSASCADLALSYYRFAAAALAEETRGVTGLQCAAFPDDRSAGDQFLAGLIVAVVSLPISAVITTCFSMSLATDFAQLRGRTRLKQWSLLQRIFFGRAPWLRGSGLWHRLKMRAAGAWSASMPQAVAVLITDAVFALRRRLRRTPAPLRPAMRSMLGPESDDVAALEAALVAEAAAFARVTARYRRGALLVLYCVWGIFSCACPAAWLRALSCAPR